MHGPHVKLPLDKPSTQPVECGSHGPGTTAHASMNGVVVVDVVVVVVVDVVVVVVGGMSAHPVSTT